MLYYTDEKQHTIFSILILVREHILVFLTLLLGSVEGEEKLEEALLHDYFQLSVNLENLYKHWSDVDSHFAQTASDFGGVRILRQDPVENLFSFICSSNNNISRITLLVEKLATNFGVLLGEVDGVQHYSFPSIEALAAEGVEAKLRSLAFGLVFSLSSVNYVLPIVLKL